MKRFVPFAFVLSFVLSGMPAVAQQNLSIDAFVGIWSGGGVAENEDSAYFQTTVRDFDVTIRRSGAGFQIDWTTVIRRGGAPDRPKIRKRKSTKTLTPSGTGGVFRGARNGDPLTGEELCWAYIKGSTLSLFLMTIDRDGTYTLQQYDRELRGSGMFLTFTSHSDGDRQRVVKGRLIKTGR